MSEQQDLPEWFERPVSATAIQCSFLPEHLADVAARLNVSPDEIARWHSMGWVSFPYEERTLEQEEINEIEFTRNVMRAGLSDAQAAHLLSQLPRPFSFDPALIAYSFSFGWVVPVLNDEEEKEEPEIVAELWMDGLSENGDVPRLEELRERLEELLVTARKQSAE